MLALTPELSPVLPVVSAPVLASPLLAELPLAPPVGSPVPVPPLVLATPLLPVDAACVVPPPVSPSLLPPPEPQPPSNPRARKSDRRAGSIEACIVRVMASTVTHPARRHKRAP